MVVYKYKHKKVYSISNNFHGGYEVITLNKKDNPCLECYFDWKDYCDYNRRFSCLEKRRGHMKYIVCFSGGHSSALVAIEAAGKYGKENVI